MIAQVSSGFGDFLTQIPLSFVLCFCVSGILLVVVSVVIVQARLKRSGERVVEQAQERYAASPKRSASIDTGDLPDLDLLVQASPPPRPSAQHDATSIPLNDDPPAQAVEVVSIQRDLVDGGLIIQMGGKSYRDLSADAQFRSSFLKIMRELGPMVREAQEMPTETASTPPVPPADAPPTLGEMLASEEPPAAPPVQTAPPPPKPDGSMPGDLPKYRLEDPPEVVKKPGRFLGRSKKEYVPVPELDIAGRIEAYLQHKLEHTPDFAERSIHVHPAPDGTVSIEVDGKFYDAVGDIEDSAVQAFMTATIAEWQERNI